MATPPNAIPATDPPGLSTVLRQLREQLLLTVSRILLLVATPVYLIDLPAVWQRGDVAALVARSLVVIVLGTIALKPPLPNRLQVYALLSTTLLLAVISTFSSVSPEISRLEYFLLITLASLLLDPREAIPFASAVILLMVGLFSGMFNTISPLSAVTTGLNQQTLLLTALIIVAYTVLLSNVAGMLLAQLAKSLHDTSIALAERDAINAQLELRVEERTQELRNSQALLQSFLDRAPAAVYVKSLDGRYLLSSSHLHDLLGLTAAQLQQNPTELPHSKQIPDWHKFDQQVIAQAQPVEGEVEIAYQDETHTYTALQFPLRDAMGKIYAIGGIASDITPRKRAEASLMRQLRLQLAIARCARTLLRAEVASEQRNERIAEVLGEFRTATELDMIGLYEFFDLQGIPRYRAVVQIPVRAQVHRSLGVPLDDISPAVLKQLLGGELITIPAAEFFLPGSVSQQIWPKIQIAGVAAVLVLEDGWPWGFVSFGTRPPYQPLEPETVAILSALAEMIGAFLTRLAHRSMTERRQRYAQTLAQSASALLTQIETTDGGSETSVLEHVLAQLRAAVDCRYTFVDAFTPDFALRTLAATSEGDLPSDLWVTLPVFPDHLRSELAAGRLFSTPIASLLDDDPSREQPFAQVGMGSILVAPLHLQGCLWGVVTLIHTTPSHRWLPDDLQLLQTAAIMLAAFLQNRQILHSLRERDHFIQRITETSPDAIYVYDLVEQQPVFTNRTIPNMLGYSAGEEQALGRYPLRALMQSEDQARLLALQEQFRQAADHELIEFLYQARHRDGDLRWLLSRSVIFARDAAGIPIQTLNLVRDITVAREAQIELEQRENLLRTISDTLPAGYLFQIIQGRDRAALHCTYVSAGVERLLGISPADALRDPRAVIARTLPDDLPILNLAHQDLTSVPQVFDAEIRQRMADDQIGWFHVRALPQYQPDGSTIWNGVVLDVRKRKADELVLSRTNHALQRRVEELAILTQIAEALMHWTDLPAALRIIGSRLLTLFSATHVAIWRCADRAGEPLFTPLALINQNETHLYGSSTPIDEAPLAQQVLTSGLGQLINSEQHDPVLCPSASAAYPSRANKGLVQPLLARGVGSGLLVVWRDAAYTDFTPDDLELAQIIASILSSALEQIRRYEQTVNQAAQEERRRLARELHDSIVQSLYSLTLLARAWSLKAYEATSGDLVEWFGQIEGIAHQTLREMRLLIYQLRSPELEELGLVEMLRLRLEAVEQRTGVMVRLETDAYQRPNIPTVEPQIYAIIQEALNNALRHAAATVITVVLRQSSEGLLVEIRDNGRGFEVTARTGGIGLSTMHERAEAIGGHLNIATARGQGTSVQLLLPVRLLTQDDLHVPR
jgi:PAS domain S-box-containing protein